MLGPVAGFFALGVLFGAEILPGQRTKATVGRLCFLPLPPAGAVSVANGGSGAALAA